MGKRNRAKNRGPPRAKQGGKAGANGGTRKSEAAGSVGASGKGATAAAKADLADDFVLYDSGADESAQSGGAAPESESSGEESSADEMGLAARDDSGAGSDVEVTFDFFDPGESDVAAVANFLGDVCESCGAEARALAEAVCAQTRVGTVVKLSDDAQPIGFISVLTVERHRSALAPLGRHLRRVCGLEGGAGKGGKKCAEKDDEGKNETEDTGATGTDKKRFYNVLRHSFSEDKDSRGARVGLILTDRVVNLPPQLVPKMQEALFLEVEWALEDEPTAELRDAYNFHWYLYITDAYTGSDGAGKGAQKAPPKKKARAGGAGDAAKEAQAGATPGEGELAFARVEDELFLAAATHTVTWPAPSAEAGPGGVRRLKMAMLIKKARMAAAVQETARVFGVSGEDGAEAAGGAEGAMGDA